MSRQTKETIWGFLAVMSILSCAIAVGNKHWMKMCLEVIWRVVRDGPLHGLNP